MQRTWKQVARSPSADLNLQFALLVSLSASLGAIMRVSPLTWLDCIVPSCVVAVRICNTLHCSLPNDGCSLQMDLRLDRELVGVIIWNYNAAPTAGDDAGIGARMAEILVDGRHVTLETIRKAPGVGNVEYGQLLLLDDASCAARQQRYPCRTTCEFWHLLAGTCIEVTGSA